MIYLCDWCGQEHDDEGTPPAPFYVAHLGAGLEAKPVRHCAYSHGEAAKQELRRFGSPNGPLRLDVWLIAQGEGAARRFKVWSVERAPLLHSEEITTQCSPTQTLRSTGPKAPTDGISGS